MHIISMTFDLHSKSQDDDDDNEEEKEEEKEREEDVQNHTGLHNPCWEQYAQCAKKEKG